ncbi:unnamed protein product [Prorocentrum cordatum]|uniref:Uncharacterized protein n=1 Tax=Prorocentrum cordatum TaxID=2364126 RepID=A0ABN9VHV8_9DINO|nr:unnamed protein product [Polarella glacialis]
MTPPLFRRSPEWASALDGNGRERAFCCVLSVAPGQSDTPQAWAWACPPRAQGAVARWSHATSLDTLARRLREEYDAKLEARLPDVPAVLAALGLPAQCERLGQEVEALQREKCSKEELNQVRAHSTAELGRHAGLLQEATSCHGALAQKVDASLADSLQKASGFAEQVARLEEQLAGCVPAAVRRSSASASRPSPAAPPRRR